MTTSRREARAPDPRWNAELIPASAPASWVRCRTLAVSWAALLAASMAGLADRPANATTATTTFNVSAVIPASCMLSASTLPFGIYSGVETNTVATVDVTCTNTTPYTVGLNAGTAPGATVNTRRMIGPNAAELKYALYQDVARTLNWGETVGTDTVSAIGNGKAQAISIYGQITPGQLVAPGAYVDLIVATVTY